MSSPFAAVSTSLEEKYPKLPERRDLMINPINPYTCPSAPGCVSVGHMFSAPSKVPNNMFIFPVSPQERHFRNSPFISRDVVPLSPAQFSPSEVRSTGSINHPRESKDMWCVDPFQGFLDYPENIPVQTGLLQSNTDDGDSTFDDWAKQLIAADGGLEPNWSEILTDFEAADARPKVHLGNTCLVASLFFDA